MTAQKRHNFFLLADSGSRATLNSGIDVVDGIADPIFPLVGLVLRLADDYLFNRGCGIEFEPQVIPAANPSAAIHIMDSRCARTRT